MDGASEGITEMEKQDKTYQDANAAVIDRGIAEGWEWGKPVDHQTFDRGRCGESRTWRNVPSSAPLDARPLSLVAGVFLALARGARP